MAKDAWADTTTPHGKLMVTVLGGLAEFERELIRARTGEGRKRAKDRGVKFGRPRKLTPHQRQEALQRLAAGETMADVARTYAVDPTTVGRLAASSLFEHVAVVTCAIEGEGVPKRMSSDHMDARRQNQQPVQSRQLRGANEARPSPRLHRQRRSQCPRHQTTGTRHGRHYSYNQFPRLRKRKHPLQVQPAQD
jgi:hypothetical protein